MRVAIFTDTYLPDLNGVATSSYTLRNALVRHGHEVFVITSELPEDSDYIDQENVMRFPGIEFKALYGYRISNLFSFKGMREIAKLNIDVIHIQTEFGIGIFGKLVAMFLNIPVVYTYHTMYEDYTHYIAGDSDSMNAFVKMIAVKLSKIYGDNCTELVVPSIKTKEVLEKYGIKKDIHVIPTGLDLALFNPDNKDEAKIQKIKDEYALNGYFTIGFVGRIAPEKSVDTLIEAIKNVEDDHIKLLIVGGGPHLEDLKELVERYSLQDRVMFTGGIDKSEIPNYYHAIDAFACASVSETQGLTYIEALATGTIVIARYDQNLENVIEDGKNGYFFTNTQELTALMKKVAYEDLSAMSQNALDNAFQFSDENFYNSIINVYEQAIEHKHFTYEILGMHERRKDINVTIKADNHNFELVLSKAVVEKFNLYKGKILEHDVFETLVDYEKVYEAYNDALKFLTAKDLTEKQLYNKLSDLEKYDEIQIDMTINTLKEKNLINDEEYAADYFEKAIKMGLGKIKAKNNLREKGISEDIIEQKAEEYTDSDEYETALKIVDKSFTLNNTKTKVNFINSMYDKLYLKGFSKETISNVIANYDFSGMDSLEEQLVLKEFDKAFNRYSDKYQGKVLYQHIYVYLLRKGFDHSLIKQIMLESGGYDEED